MATRKRPARLRPGTPVVSRVGMRGEVLRHVRGADGGVYVVRWENASIGRIAPFLIRQIPVLVDDPNGYILSLNAGDDLSHFERLETAIDHANSARWREGYDQADVWHAVSEHSTAIDYDRGVEYSAPDTDPAD